MNVDVLLTNRELCVGCNKCIAKCLVKANVAYQYKEENKVKVDQNKCIRCGACIDVCDHNARGFVDDTERFFSDLKRGMTLSVIAAPSIQFNFPNYKRFYGYLKSLEVKLIYDVAIGADITTWAYLKVIKEQGLDSIIAQPCPVIVNYIQKYRPELIRYLAPIHSPMMCTAIYLKEYEGVKDRIAFLSPCIGKIDEINERYTDGLVKYNVTFVKIEHYLISNSIDLINYPEVECDVVGGSSTSLTFSRPGGLRKSVELSTNSAWVRQIEGPHRAYSYLDEYTKRVHEGKLLPLIVDILNCQSGCNIGTGTSKTITIDEIDSKIKELKKEKIQKQNENTLNNGDPALFETLEGELRLSDFARRYEDKSQFIHNEKTIDLGPIFLQLHKTTEASQNINCCACGFGNCKEFAKAVLEGTNNISNCIYYNRKELAKEKEYIIQSNKEVKQLHYLATHDFLTEIPNRYYLEKYLKELILSEAGKQSESALLFIDLDNFKVVNDSFGHASGDKILLNVVDRLQINLGQGAFLARLGGDEFAIVLRNTGLEKARAAANQLIQALRIEDFKVEGHQVLIKVTASIGIVMIDGKQDTQTLFSYAEIALYTAKDEGKNRISYIQSGGTDRLSESTRTILQINDALKENRFTLYFQPVIKRNGKIIHYEALLRMIDREGNLIVPNDFLPTAERFGLMSQIDRWVVDLALEILGKRPELSVFVNISASSLGDEELLKFIEARIDESNIEPSRIGFEITETAAIRDIDQAEHWIRRLKLKGCKFALDDFGVGFITFTHLQRLPVDYLKIDGSFIRNLDVDPTNKALVQAINSVAHALGKATIAEYVESESIWSVLRELQIDCGQGYFLGKPAPFSGEANNPLAGIPFINEHGKLNNVK